ncbi:2-succinyl-5-enolpyruvyl-6-hydroxy-3-cyclohexene-1-carboxylic-acid synthase [Saccharothrix yanglingensis]|uniref:2-succinyl-5-enolpyruvyl-6-hydroxy-3-cyclohexene-1-carboxylate synthase n=1 Tax=Saccharothrix yanglingensis TaxID=659496 RepID=A0ABU0WT13_9PSEU|nr:2-succinyl-5-enolpyruvyl-6-hydroxy-3-cyclohexene-1-carboxylic-acid synthase [Saccharothrix yanglingensis]MDQ2582663.1 2-succinyl-5-enolpyruvyl-6-hydroxy-3-cyclohexene-1-carboxylic-acid synthase [Saccharothrix yanglingensis]
MNPSTAQARVLVDELIRNDVRHVVLSPGSRNAPLSFALHEAAVAGRITLHVRVDERTAGFLALGLARGDGRPVAVTCTSGTAVANLHPAVLEARHANVPVIALTADRPVELYRTGASQTVDQQRVFGLDTLQFPVAERRTGQNGLWRSLVCRVVATAREQGPVHLNVPFRDPLVPDGDDDWPEDLDGRPFDVPWTRVAERATTSLHSADHLGPRTLVVVGDTDLDITDLAERAGWPVVAEPTESTGLALRHGSLLLNSDLPAHLEPQALVVVGRPTLTRGVLKLIARTPVVHVLSRDLDWPDPQFTATHTSTGLVLGEHEVDHDWLTSWQHADKAVSDVVDDLLAGQPWPTGLHVARDVVAALPAGANLFLGSSNPVRDVDLVAAPRPDVTTFANRGVAGIDGSVSTAAGLALTAGPTVALIGDLTFLHDANGLLIGPGEPRPDLTVVVLNDDGGGIFALLEQGAPEHATTFERVFGTPHGVDLAALCAAHHVPHVRALDADHLRRELGRPDGIKVVEIRAERKGLRTLHARLKAAVSTAFH